jgi:S1-C subfamily serine protease
MPTALHSRARRVAELGPQVDTARVSHSGARNTGAFSGVAFAIPSDTARTIASQLIATGRADHAWLGVEVETIDQAVAAVEHRLPAHGVTVAQVVKGSPAAKAGLEAATRQVT